MLRVRRTVSPTFCDIRLDNKYYRCDPKLRGDRIEVRYDPFTRVDSVEIYSLDGQYLQTALLHDRLSVPAGEPPKPCAKPQHNYLDLLIRQHDRLLDEQTRGIDYRKIVTQRSWPFHQFAKTLAELLALKGGLSAFNAEQIEKLKKIYNQSTKFDKHMLKQAFARADHKSLPYVCHELKLIINEINEKENK